MSQPFLKESVLVNFSGRELVVVVTTASTNATANTLISRYSGEVDCKTVGFFLKISKEIGKAWRKSLTRARRASLTRP